MRLRYWLLLALVIPLCGCVTTKYFSSLNPECKDSKYQRILVEFTDREPTFRQYGEKTVQDQVKLLYGGAVQTYLFSNEFYLGLRNFDEIKGEVQKFMASKHIDALLLCVSAQGSNEKTSTYTNPPPAPTKKGQPPAPYYPTTSSYTTQEKSADYRLELFDVRAAKSVWYSTGHLDTNSTLYSFENLMNRFVVQAVADLHKENLLGERAIPSVEPLNKKQKKPAKKKKRKGTLT